MPMRLMTLTLALVAATPAWPQNFPTKPIRIVTSQAGGLNDLTARVLAQGLTPTLGKPVIVDNRGLPATDIVMRAAPDGYTLLCFANNLWLLPLMQEKAGYDPLRDYAPVTLAVTAPNVLALHGSVAARTTGELISMAKSKPGALNYGAGAPGGTPHLAAELFKAMAKVDMVHVAYKGTGAALTALFAGEIHLMFAGPGMVEPHAKTGKLKMLAVTSRAPSALTPGLPTLSEAALPGYEATAMITLFAPARTPANIVSRLQREIAAVLTASDAQTRLLAAGVEVSASTPEQLSRVMKAEMARWGPIIRQAGIRE